LKPAIGMADIVIHLPFYSPVLNLAAKN